LALGVFAPIRQRRVSLAYQTRDISSDRVQGIKLG